MNNYHKKKNHSILTTAIITLVVFAVLLYALINPSGFYNLTHPNSNFDTSQDFIKFLDVGQGDSALIYSNGYSAVIDVGQVYTVNELSEDLYDCNITALDVVLISHLHSDHVGALPQIAQNFGIKNLIMPEILKRNTVSAKSGKNIATKNGSAFYTAKQGMNFNIGEFEITLLSDFSDKSNENNRSVFVMAEINGIKFLFTGDAEAEMEQKLLDENLNIDCDVLKVSHHGSDTSTTKDFLNATTPDYAVISVGENNSYGHPDTDTLENLEKAHIKTYRTDQSGDITFYIDDNQLTVIEEK